MDRSHPRLSVGEQCSLLSLPRSTFHYKPLGETPLNLTLSTMKSANWAFGALGRQFEIAGRWWVRSV